MRLALAVGRLSCRLTESASLPSLTRLGRNTSRTPLWCPSGRTRVASSPFSTRAAVARSQPKQWRSSSGGRNGSRILLMAGANGALATAAFVRLSEEENNGPEDTAERRMLEVSRKEIKKEVDENDTGLTRIRHQVVLFLDVYIWEPVCTGVRFLQLVVIFVPVILAVPAMWIGRRQPERDNERTGTLWWYNFLVKAMEWAGPAFIKVCMSMGCCRRVSGLTRCV